MPDFSPLDAGFRQTSKLISEIVNRLPCCVGFLTRFSGLSVFPLWTTLLPRRRSYLTVVFFASRPIVTISFFPHPTVFFSTCQIWCVTSLCSISPLSLWVRSKRSTSLNCQPYLFVVTVQKRPLYSFIHRNKDIFTANFTVSVNMSEKYVFI